MAKKRSQAQNTEDELTLERRKNMDEFTQALRDNTAAINALQLRFERFDAEAKQRQTKIDHVDEQVNGNGKPGIIDQVRRLQIFANIIMTLATPATIALIVWLFTKGVELIYSHNVSGTPPMPTPMPTPTP